MCGTALDGNVENKILELVVSLLGAGTCSKPFPSLGPTLSVMEVLPDLAKGWLLLVVEAGTPCQAASLGNWPPCFWLLMGQHGEGDSGLSVLIRQS